MIVIVNGAGGRLGQEVLKAAKGAGHSVVAVDKSGVSPEAVTYRDLADYTGAADVVIDFSSHLATAELTSYVVKRYLPLVLATTGQTLEEKEMIYAAAKKVPLFFSANMSFGVALLISLVKKAAELLPGDDIEIGFNSRFFQEMLNNLDTEEVKLEMSAPNRAGILTPVNNQTAGEDILMLLMPVMLNS